jgi:hypothetical protein
MRELGLPVHAIIESSGVINLDTAGVGPAGRKQLS